MLESVGLSTSAEQVYSAVVREPRSTVPHLATMLSLPPERVRRAVAELRELDLVESSPDGARGGTITAVDPRIGLGKLVRSRHSQLEQVVSLAEQLAVEFRESQLRTDPVRLVEVIDGPAAISQRMADLLAGAREDIMNLYAPPYVTPDMTGSDEAGKLRSGVRIRVLYAAEALGSAELLDRVLADVAAGEEARVLRTVPLKLLIVDRTYALLPLTSTEEGTRGSAVLVHRSRLTDALVSLFEALWANAATLSASAETLDLDGTGELEPSDRTLLRLLDAGLKDETIARHLRLSERTLRRRVTELLDRLGATSRFQAGAQAVRRGWLA